MEARPGLHYIFVSPFRGFATGFDAIVLASLLTSLLYNWEEQKTVNQKSTFSLQYTELSWRSAAETSAAETSGAGIGSRVRPTLMRWKRLAEIYQMEVLDGYGIDIRDITVPSDGRGD